MTPDARIAEQAWAFYMGDHDHVIAWLVLLGCTVVEEHEHGWIMDGNCGVRCGLSRTNSDAILVVATIGLLLAGKWWAAVFPDALGIAMERANAQARERRAAKKAVA